MLFLGLVALASIGVPLNALYLQDGRHPAPLFHLAGSEPAPSKAAATPPLPPQRPAAVAQAKSAPTKGDITKAETTHANEKPRDLIGALLDGALPKSPATAARSASGKSAIAKTEGAKTEGAKTEGVKTEGVKTEAGKSDGPNKNVIFAQRALAKLGYALRQDGVLGGTTRQAIEKFERDSGLPVKGELTPRLMRQLSARSGVARN